MRKNTKKLFDYVALRGARPLAVVLAFVVAIPSASAQQAPSFVPSGSYQWVRYRNEPRPQKLEIKEVDNSAHGTYSTFPYYAFITDPNTGKQYLVSDGRLKAELTLIAGSAGVRPRADDKTKYWQVAKYKLNVLRSSSGTLPKFTDATLSINDPACNDEACFMVSGTDNFAELPSGSNEFTMYVVKAQKPDNTAKDDQTWGSSFRPQEHYEPLYYVTGCWDVRKLGYLDYQLQNCNAYLFALPGEESKNYTRPTGGITLPYGWSYDATTYSNSESTTMMISNSRDLMNSVKRTTGFNISGSVDASYGFASAEASFSFDSSNGQMQKMANMREDKTVFTQSQYHHIAYAIVADKVNMTLHGDFKRAVGNLLADLSAGRLTDRTVLDFLAIYGTHYAYAVTYGAQGAATYRFTEQQVSQLLEQGVSYSQAWKANVSVKVMGSGGAIGGGSSSASDQDMQKKFSNIMQQSTETYTCSGGASCSGGVPSGEPNVPVFLDLRPISELLGPPFYTDPNIVLDLRDRLYEVIQKSALNYLKDLDGPPMGIVELTFQPPECPQTADPSCSNVVWGPIDVATDAASTLIPRANMRISETTNSPAFTLDFAQGVPTALLVPNGETASLSASSRFALRGAVRVWSPQPGETAPPKDTPLAFPPQSFPSKPDQTIVLIASQPITIAAGSTTPVIRVKVGPANLSKLLGVQ